MLSSHSKKEIDSQPLLRCLCFSNMNRYESSIDVCVGDIKLTPGNIFSHACLEEHDAMISILRGECDVSDLCDAYL